MGPALPCTVPAATAAPAGLSLAHAMAVRRSAQHLERLMRIDCPPLQRRSGLIIKPQETPPLSLNALPATETSDQKFTEPAHISQCSLHRVFRKQTFSSRGSQASQVFTVSAHPLTLVVSEK